MFGGGILKMRSKWSSPTVLAVLAVLMAGGLAAVDSPSGAAGILTSKDSSPTWSNGRSCPSTPP